MDDKRKGEIAYLFLKNRLKEEGFDLDQNFRRRIGNIAKKIGVPFPEALEFSMALVGELLVEVGQKDTPPSEEELQSFDHFHGHGGH